MNVIQSKADVEIIGAARLDELKEIASASPQKRSRILLHEGPDAVVQEMVIVLHRDGYFRPHRHPYGKHESYHILEGQMLVKLYDDDGTEKMPQFILGRESGNFMYHLRGGIYHQPIALTEWAVYHEVYTGPYNKEWDVHYAPWSKEEA